MFEEKEEELFRHIVAALSADMPVIELAEKEDRQQIQASGLTILPQKRQVTINGRDLPLSPLEFSVLRYLSAHPGWIVSQEELYQAVWKEGRTGKYKRGSLLHHLQPPEETQSAYL